MNRPAIEVRDLSFSYPASKAPALKHIRIDIAEGEWVSIMGPTGAGKSTFSLCLNGLIPHMQAGKLEGSVTIFGEDAKDLSVPYLSSKVGVVFQDFNTQLFSSQVKLELAFGMENFCIRREHMKERVEALLEQFNLQRYSDSHPAELSGGERQRLAIASILALSPRILVLDEPTTDLDPLNREKLLSIVKEMGQDGLTIIWIDHDTKQAFESNRLIIMDQAELAHQTTFRDFFAKTDLAEAYRINAPDIPRLFEGKPLKKMPVNYAEAMATIKHGRKDFRWTLSGEKQKAYLAKNPPASSGKTLISIEDLCHKYPNGIEALKGVGLQVRQGDFLAIIGQNGSGKTTLAKHINGLLKPTSGRVIVNGQNNKYRSIYELSKGVGFCFQNPDNQIFASTVLEEVSFGPKNYQFPSSRIHANVKDALEAVGLAGYEEKDPFVLTRGERQRIAVASILSMKPEIIIFDEPTTGLDYSQTLSMMALIRRLNDQGCTIIIITHAMWVAAQYARRCVVMAEGKILMDDSTHEVFSKEAILKEASLRPPDIVRLGNSLGVTTLSVEEFMECLE